MNNPHITFVMPIFRTAGGRKTKPLALTAAFLAAGLLVSCTAEDPVTPTSTHSSAQGTSTHSAVPSQPSNSDSRVTSEHENRNAQLVVANAWVKAGSMSGHSMTGAFMEVTNSSAKEITISSVTTGAAEVAELHETVAGTDGSTQMRKVEHGLSIPAGASRLLEPGGDHVMLIGLKQDLVAGDQVVFQLHTTDGKSIEVVADIRDFAGAKEEYSHSETSEQTNGHGLEEHHDGNSQSHPG